MKIAAAIRHVHFEDLGVFEPVLADRGYTIQYYEAGIDDLKSPSLIAHDLLVVLGAPIGVYEEDKYPFISDEIRLLQERHSRNLPTIGICLGAQLLARSLGCRVYPGPGKEIGWAPVTLTKPGCEGVTRHLRDIPVLHWHGDTFDLPAEAELLASTPICRNQAFRCGRNVIAFQFHPEVSHTNFERWLVGHAVEIGGVADLTVNALRTDTLRFAPQSEIHGQRCLSEWLNQLAE